MIVQEMFSGSADAGFILVLPFYHGDIEPDCVGVSTRGGLMCRIKMPLQDFALKMQGSPLVETPTQSGSRSQWWNGGARTKPASTEPLNISQSWEGVVARENVAFPPPLRFVLRLRLQRGGAYLRDTTVLLIFF